MEDGGVSISRSGITPSDSGLLQTSLVSPLLSEEESTASDTQETEEYEGIDFESLNPLVSEKAGVQDFIQNIPTNNLGLPNKPIPQEEWMANNPAPKVPTPMYIPSLLTGEKTLTRPSQEQYDNYNAEVQAYNNSAEEYSNIIDEYNEKIDSVKLKYKEFDAEVTPALAKILRTATAESIEDTFNNAKKGEKLDLSRLKTNEQGLEFKPRDMESTKYARFQLEDFWNGKTEDFASMIDKLTIDQAEKLEGRINEELFELEQEKAKPPLILSGGADGSAGRTRVKKTYTLTDGSQGSIDEKISELKDSLDTKSYIEDYRPIQARMWLEKYVKENVLLSEEEWNNSRELFVSDAPTGLEPFEMSLGWTGTYNDYLGEAEVQIHEDLIFSKEAYDFTQALGMEGVKLWLEGGIELGERNSRWKDAELSWRIGVNEMAKTIAAAATATARDTEFIGGGDAGDPMISRFRFTMLDEDDTAAAREALYKFDEERNARIFELRNRQTQFALTQKQMHQFGISALSNEVNATEEYAGIFNDAKYNLAFREGPLRAIESMPLSLSAMGVGLVTAAWTGGGSLVASLTTGGLIGVGVSSRTFYDSYSNPLYYMQKDSEGNFILDEDGEPVIDWDKPNITETERHGMATMQGLAEGAGEFIGMMTMMGIGNFVKAGGISPYNIFKSTPRLVQGRIPKGMPGAGRFAKKTLEVSKYSPARKLLDYGFGLVYGSGFGALEEYVAEGFTGVSSMFIDSYYSGKKYTQAQYIERFHEDGYIGAWAGAGMGSGAVSASTFKAQYERVFRPETFNAKAAASYYHQLTNSGFFMNGADKATRKELNDLLQIMAKETASGKGLAARTDETIKDKDGNIIVQGTGTRGNTIEQENALKRINELISNLDYSKNRNIKALNKMQAKGYYDLLAESIRMDNELLFLEAMSTEFSKTDDGLWMNQDGNLVADPTGLKMFDMNTKLSEKTREEYRDRMSALEGRMELFQMMSENNLLFSEDYVAPERKKGISSWRSKSNKNDYTEVVSKEDGKLDDQAPKSGIEGKLAVWASKAKGRAKVVIHKTKESLKAVTGNDTDNALYMEASPEQKSKGDVDEMHIFIGDANNKVAESDIIQNMTHEFGHFIFEDVLKDDATRERIASEIFDIAGRNQGVRDMVDRVKAAYGKKKNQESYDKGSMEREIINKFMQAIAQGGYAVIEETSVGTGERFIELNLSDITNGFERWGMDILNGIEGMGGSVELNNAESAIRLASKFSKFVRGQGGITAKGVEATEAVETTKATEQQKTTDATQANRGLDTPLLDPQTNQPIVFYHGTSKSAGDKILAEGFTGNQFSLTSRQTQAQNYATSGPRTSGDKVGTVIKSHVTLNNPMNFQQNMDLREKIIGEITGKSPEELAKPGYGLTTAEWQKYTAQINREFIKRAKELGYDGIYDVNQPEIIVFDPNSIKVVESFSSNLASRNLNMSDLNAEGPTTIFYKAEIENESLPRFYTQEINDYGHFKNLYSYKTGNGDAPGRMIDAYYMKGGKRINLETPEVVLDRRTGEKRNVNIPFVESYSKYTGQQRLQEGKIKSELSGQWSDLTKEVSQLYGGSDKKLNLYTQERDFEPSGVRDFETVEGLMNAIESLMVKRENIQALIDSDMTREELVEIAGGKGKDINKATNPEIFNMSGRLAPESFSQRSDRLNNEIQEYGAPWQLLPKDSPSYENRIPDLRMATQEELEYAAERMERLKAGEPLEDHQLGFDAGLASRELEGLANRGLREIEGTLPEGWNIEENYARWLIDSGYKLKDIVIDKYNYDRQIVGWVEIEIPKEAGGTGTFRYYNSGGVWGSQTLKDSKVVDKDGNEVNIITSHSGDSTAEGAMGSMIKADNAGKVHVSLFQVLKKGNSLNAPKQMTEVMNYISKYIEFNPSHIPAIIEAFNKKFDGNAGAGVVGGRLGKFLNVSYTSRGAQGLKKGIKNISTSKEGREGFPSIEITSEEGLKTFLEHYGNIDNSRALGFVNDVRLGFLNGMHSAVRTSINNLEIAKGNKKYKPGFISKSEYLDKINQPEYKNAKNGDVVAANVRQPRKKLQGSTEFDGELRSVADLRNEFSYDKNTLEKTFIKNIAYTDAVVTNQPVENFFFKQTIPGSIVDKTDHARKSAGFGMTTTEKALKKGLKKAEIDAAEATEATKQAARRLPGRIYMQGNSSWEQSAPTKYGAALEHLAIKLQDKFSGVMLLQQDVEKFRGSKVPQSQDFEMAMDIMYGMVRTDLERLEGELERINTTMEDSGLTAEQVSDYLYAKHAGERNIYINSKRPEMLDGSGMTTQEAEDIINELETPEMVAVAKLVYDIVANTRKTMVEGGLEKASTIETYEGLYKNYVPLSGLAADEIDDENNNYPTGGAGMAIYGKTTKAAKGRASKTGVNLIANVIMQNAMVKQRARKDQAMLSLYNLTKNNPNEKVWGVYSAKNPRMKTDETGQQVGMNAFEMKASPNMVPIRINGEQHFIYFKKKDYAQALNGETAERLGFVAKKMSGLLGFMRNSFTQYNPAFFVGNYFRDVHGAIYNVLAEVEREGGIMQGYGINSKKFTKDVIKGSFTTLKALLSESAFGREMGEEMREYLNEWEGCRRSYRFLVFRDHK
jgi:hypothetical protein